MSTGDPICHICGDYRSICRCDEMYGAGVSKQQLLSHFSEEDLMEIIGIEKMVVYIRKKKLEKIRKK